MEDKDLDKLKMNVSAEFLREIENVLYSIQEAKKSKQASKSKENDNSLNRNKESDLERY